MDHNCQCRQHTLCFVFWGQLRWHPPGVLSAEQRCSMIRSGKWLPAQLTMKFDQRYILRIQELYQRPHFTVGGSWNKSLRLQSLQRCYCENSGTPASACVMRRHFSIKYMQSLLAINALLAMGCVGNLLVDACSKLLQFPGHLGLLWIELLSRYA